MGYTIEDACQMECPDCHGCSKRFRKFKKWYCDDCGDETNELYIGEHNDELCWECYQRQFISKICDDCDDTVCSECGSESEELYLVEGEWICSECLMDRAERVDTCTE